MSLHSMKGGVSGCANVCTRGNTDARNVIAKVYHHGIFQTNIVFPNGMFRGRLDHVEDHKN